MFLEVAVIVPTGREGIVSKGSRFFFQSSAEDNKRLQQSILVTTFFQSHSLFFFLSLYEFPSTAVPQENTVPLYLANSDR